MRRIVEKKCRRLWPHLESGLYVPPLLMQRERLPLLNPGIMDRGMGRRCCPVEEGLDCVCSDAPDEWSIEVSGVASGGSCGAACTNFNGTFIVTNPFEIESVYGPLCVWSFEYPSAICGRYYLVLRVEHHAVGMRIVVSSEVDLELPFFGFLMAFIKTYASPVSCSLNSESLPSNMVCTCDLTLATCLITAL